MTVEEKIITESAATARHYLDRALLAPLSEFGLLMKDTVSYWRFKNQVNTILKAKAFLDAKGLDPQKIRGQIDPEIVVPLIEAAATTSTEPLPELFSGLLAASLQVDYADHVHKSFIQVLQNLSPFDAQILRLLKRLVDKEISQGRKIKRGDKEVLATHRELGLPPEFRSSDDDSVVPESQVVLCFENLWRLGLCDRGPGALENLNRVNRICLTDYGLAFLNACTKDISELPSGG